MPDRVITLRASRNPTRSAISSGIRNWYRSRTEGVVGRDKRFCHTLRDASVAVILPAIGGGAPAVRCVDGSGLCCSAGVPADGELSRLGRRPSSVKAGGSAFHRGVASPCKRHGQILRPKRGQGDSNICRLTGLDDVLTDIDHEIADLQHRVTTVLDAETT